MLGKINEKNNLIANELHYRHTVNVLKWLYCNTLYNCLSETVKYT